MLLLRLDHGLSYDEIAGLMGFSVAKVKVEIFRAREVLRETMAELRKRRCEVMSCSQLEDLDELVMGELDASHEPRAPRAPAATCPACATSSR